MFKTNFLPVRFAMVAFGLILGPAVASAQSDMSCADYLKAEAKMQADMNPADRAQMQVTMHANPQAAALDAKMKAYCRANPKASSSEAMMKSAQ